MRLTAESFHAVVALVLVFEAFWLIGCRGVTRRGKGGTIPIPQAPKCPNNVTSYFFNAVHLLPKDLRFEHGGAKLASCPWRYINSLPP